MKRTPKDALDQPIGADTMYAAVQPFSGSIDGAPHVRNPRTPLPGDSAAVRAFPHQFVSVSAPPSAAHIHVRDF